MNGEGSILDGVSFHFFCDTLKSKVLRAWSRVVKATKEDSFTTSRRGGYTKQYRIGFKVLAPTVGKVST